MKLFHADNNTTIAVDYTEDSPLGSLILDSTALKKIPLDQHAGTPTLVLVGHENLTEAESALQSVTTLFPKLSNSIHKTVLITSHSPTKDDDYVSLIDSGFDEILRLPITQRAFDEKISRDLARIANAREVQVQLEQARLAAYAAMTTASDLGKLILYMDRCHTIHDYDHLATATLQLMESFNLKSTLLLRDEKKEYWTSTYPVFPAIHKDFLCKVEERIFTHKQAISVRFEHCSLLVTNAPHNDDVRMGQLRDMLAHVANALESKVRQIMLFNLIESQHAYMITIMGLIQRSSIETKEYTATIMRNLVTDLETQAVSMDLTEDQERRIVALANATSDNLDVLLKSNNVIEEHFSSLLNSVALAKTLSQSEAPPPDIGSNDVELF